MELLKVSKANNIKSNDKETILIFIWLCCRNLVWDPLTCNKCDNHFCKEYI